MVWDTEVFSRKDGAPRCGLGGVQIDIQMGDFQNRGVEEKTVHAPKLAGRLIVPAIPVDRVSDDGVRDSCEMSANLVGEPGFDLDLHERISGFRKGTHWEGEAEVLQGSIVRASRFTFGVLSVVFDFRQRAIDQRPVGSDGKVPSYNCQVVLHTCPLPKSFGNFPSGLSIFCKQECTRCRSIQAMDTENSVAELPLENHLSRILSSTQR